MYSYHYGDLKENENGESDQMSILKVIFEPGQVIVIQNSLYLGMEILLLIPHERMIFYLVCWLYTKKRSANFGIPLNGWYQSNAGGWELIEDVKISMRD